ISGYFTQTTTIKTKCETMNDTVFVQLMFERIVINKPIVIENIYYDYDKWDIRPDAALELDKIVTLLIENPTIIIELGSHTDSRGSDKYNETLSQKRAESAVQYIVEHGIVADRITAKGYGEYKLVNKCSNGVKCSEEEHQLNRRTEFKVTGFSKEQPIIYSTVE
ncbi:MAG: OmpA family protein, partial [Bacteroidales bacterium]|nr:OmpA family protein [Bacteroidales bacterium]